MHYLPMAADPTVHRPMTLTAAEHREFGSDVSFVGAGYANRRTLLPQWLSHEWTMKLWGMNGTVPPRFQECFNAAVPGSIQIPV